MTHKPQPHEIRAVWSFRSDDARPATHPKFWRRATKGRLPEYSAAITRSHHAVAAQLYNGQIVYFRPKRKTP